MKIISKETSKRVCDHMNNDHIDSVHKYLIHYGKISRFENAYMEEINNSYIKINYDGQSAIINFKKKISSSKEIENNSNENISNEIQEIKPDIKKTNISNSSVEDIFGDEQTFPFVAGLGKNAAH